MKFPVSRGFGREDLVRTDRMPFPKQSSAEGDKKRKDEDEEGETLLQGKEATGQHPNIPNGLECRIHTFRGAGQALQGSSRTFFEQRYNHDFSRVRIHADREASELAHALNSRAFTAGENIFFRADQYAPETPDGRRLIAHELAHVLQQTDLRLSPRINRATAAEGQIGQSALQTALHGDDDDVRNLTGSLDWKEVVLSADLAAQLIIKLLMGPTLDEDEQAGLSILIKALDLKIFDDTLQELKNEGKFGQLFDDYHGKEYRDLLDLLAQHIEKFSIKALFLDKFISMYWVNEDEEEAIVVLLEHTLPDDQAKLLVTESRYLGLRDAIDDEALSCRYEKIMQNVNIQRGAEISSQLNTVFSIKAEASKEAGKRSEAEVNHLLERAAADLAAELLDYATRLNIAVSNPKTKSSDIAAINREFEERLDRLKDDKSAEFGFELSYNIEFNRSLVKAFERAWTKEDLAEMDRILSMIPAEILHANPNFEQFEREREGPKYGGQAREGEGGIALPGSLELVSEEDDTALRTVVHELAHFVHYDEPKLLDEFMARFKWEPLLKADFPKLISSAKDRAELLAELDEDRKEKSKYGREAFGDYYFRYNKYQRLGDPDYFRYPKSACFISKYAKTHPKDDFADTFEEYFVEPDNLRSHCPDKYLFMHTRVFVEYFLKKRISSIEKRFKEKADEELLKITSDGGWRDKILLNYLKPLSEKMTIDLNALMQPAVEKAKKSLGKARPLKDYSQEEDIYRSYDQRLRDLGALALSISERVTDFSTSIMFIELFSVKKKDISAFHVLSLALTARLIEDTLALLDPLAKRIMKGEHIEKPEWPELKTIADDYSKVINPLSKKGVTPVEAYLPLYARALEIKRILEVADVFGFSDEEWNKLGWQEGKQKAIDNIQVLLAELKKVMAEIVNCIVKGQPFQKPGRTVNPDLVLKNKLKELTKKPAK